MSAAALQPGASVLDIGAGTGRVAVALAESCCDVVALEPAELMLRAARHKAAGMRVRFVTGEGARLPLQAACFDAVVLARILYLMTDWRDVLGEVVRVLKPRGVLLHEWGNGEVDEGWVQIREKARALFEGAGVAAPFHPGARSEARVVDALVELGLRFTRDVHIGPGPSMTLTSFVNRIVDGECSYIWNVPAEVQRQCLPELKAWASERFDLDRAVSLPRDISWKIYQQVDR